MVTMKHFMVLALATTATLVEIRLAVAFTRNAIALSGRHNNPSYHFNSDKVAIKDTNSDGNNIVTAKATIKDASTASTDSNNSENSVDNSNASRNDEERIILHGLQASKFRHPLDQDLTSLIQSLPGGSLVETALRRSFPLIEQGVRLDLLASSVKTSPQQLPNLHKLLVDACAILDLNNDKQKGDNGIGGGKMPELYIQSNTMANAYTLAIRGDSEPPIIVVTSALVDRCTEAELQAIIGHELGHLKCEHSVYLTLGGILSAPIRNLPIPPLLLPGQASIDNTLQKWRLAAEYTCDRASLLVVQDAKVVTSALLKLFAGTSKYDLDVDAYIQQCLEYDRQLENANPFIRMSIKQQESERTHPLPIRRVAELSKYSKSNGYQNIISQQGQ